MTEIDDAFRQLRRKVADLSFDESFKAAWAFSQYRQVVDFPFPADVERHASFTREPLTQPFPWQLETLTQEVIANAGEVSRRGRSLCRWNTVADVVNALRALEDRLFAKSLVPAAAMHELLRIAHQQFVWQRPLTTRFIGRNFQIFKGPAVNAICLRITGLTVPKIYLIGTALWAHYSTKPFLRLPWLSEVQKILQRDIDSFLRLYGEELYALRQRIKSNRPTIDETFAYDHRHIRGTPLIRFRRAGAEILACPLPTLLVWRFTSGLYYDLTSEPDFFNVFGSAFQEYIGRALSRALEGTSMRCLPEAPYGTKKRPKDTVDWVVVDTDAAAFIECKAKRLTLKAKTLLSSKEALAADIRVLAGYILQVYQTIEDYKKGLYPSLAYNSARAIYPVIVTPEDWYPLGTDFWNMLQGEIRVQFAEAGLAAGIIDKTPFALASTDELERAAQIISGVGLRNFFTRYHTPAYSGWMLDRYIADAFKNSYSQSKDLFPESFDEITEAFS